MKTPREILWQRHRSVEHKLDAVRQKALASLVPAGTERLLTPTLSSTEEEREKSAVPSMVSIRVQSLVERIPGRGLREMLLSFRWHFAGMSAAWVLVALLNIDRSSSPVAAMAKERIPSPQQLLAALRENRRQIAELLESPANVSEPSPAPPSFVPKRRGEIQSPSAKA